MESVSRHNRSLIKGHPQALLWFMGLSGSGKSTLAQAVEQQLYCRREAHAYILDGDAMRAGLNRDLGFTPEARAENVRRTGEVARLFFDAGLIVIAALISPFCADRGAVRALLPEGAFFEIYVRCPLDLCEQRDPKGLYRKARAGRLADFTGVASPYEDPLNPELVVDNS